PEAGAPGGILPGPPPSTSPGFLATTRAEPSSIDSVPRQPGQFLLHPTHLDPQRCEERGSRPRSLAPADAVDPGGCSLPEGRSVPELPAQAAQGLGGLHQIIGYRCELTRRYLLFGLLCRCRRIGSNRFNNVP